MSLSGYKHDVFKVIAVKQLETAGLEYVTGDYADEVIIFRDLGKPKIVYSSVKTMLSLDMFKQT
jgi:hypothetical protein